MSMMMIAVSLIVLMALLFGAVTVVFSMLMRRERDRAALMDADPEFETFERLAAAQNRRFVP